jgi:hypothetical protein
MVQTCNEIMYSISIVTPHTTSPLLHKLLCTTLLSHCQLYIKEIMAITKYEVKKVTTVCDLKRFLFLSHMNFVLKVKFILQYIIFDCVLAGCVILTLLSLK